MDDLNERLDGIDADLLRLSIRVSAHEWLIEQVTANLLVNHPDDADAFLDAISHDDGRAFQREPEYTRPPIPPLQAALYEEISRIAEKIRVRVRQGRRRD